MAEEPLAPNALHRLLQDERTALQQGDFTQLAPIAERKAALLARLKHGDLRADLVQLRAMAQGNAALLEAALQGIRAARTRLQVIREAARGFQSYDQSGRGQRISRANGQSLEHRA